MASEGDNHQMCWLIQGMCLVVIQGMHGPRLSILQICIWMGNVVWMITSFLIITHNLNLHLIFLLLFLKYI